MAADNMELREILENNIGEVYKNALASVGDTAAAKEVTRRVMALLKRTYETGLSITPEMVKRLTDDCCREQACYDSKKAAFRDGIIADMPDFDTAISAITEEEVRSKARSDAENKAIEAHRAMREAEALGAKVVSAQQPTTGYAPPQRHFSCAADLFDDFDEEVGDEPKAKPAEEPISMKTVRERVEKDWEKFDMDDDDFDDDDDYDDDDDDDDDDEYESPFKSKAKSPVLPLIGIWVMIVLLACVGFCLAVMLMQRNVLPGGSSAFVQKFATWFNSHLFPLF